MKRQLLYVWLCLLFCCGSFSGCQNKTSSFSRSGFALDTAVAVTVYGVPETTAATALDACFAEIERLEALLSVTRPNSDIDRLNTANGALVSVAPETAEVLSLALEYGALSDGAFDVTVRPLTLLWNFTGDTSTVPDSELLAQAVKAVDYRCLTVKGQTAQLQPGGSVDLGGIAKGYIADAVSRVLKRNGVTSALIDLGGNIVVCGNKQGKDFRIGVKNPADTTALCAVITGQDISAVTSGIYERGFTKDGVRYHHLLDPKTGMPVQNGLASVTVVCRSSAAADALSTACFVLGEQRGAALIQSLDDTEALFIRQDGTYFATAGLTYTFLGKSQ